MLEQKWELVLQITKFQTELEYFILLKMHQAPYYPVLLFQMMLPKEEASTHMLYTSMVQAILKLQTVK